MNDIKLAQDKNLCCGCAACAQICPKNAITMQEDQYGAIYPQINFEKCIGCHLCERTCMYQNKVDRSNEPCATYAVQLKDENIVQNSSSGGAFAALAETILEQGGVVFGCMMKQAEQALLPEHDMIDCLEDLPKLQGSKYVKSDTSMVYQNVRKQLASGRMVLFSGTPCQVDGLRCFLQGKNYENLLTVDLICHGTPSTKFFKDYLLNKEKKGKICGFEFRNKDKGWGQFDYCCTIQKKGERHIEKRPSSRSSYYWAFLNGMIYRENCYSCPYASLRRVSDITLGDWWGIEQEYPHLFKENDGFLERKRGVSCVLINTPQGQSWLNKCSDKIMCCETDTMKLAKYNKQLNRPSQMPESYRTTMEAYAELGYVAIDKLYKSKIGA